MRTLTPKLVSALAALVLTTGWTQAAQAQGTRAVGVMAGANHGRQLIARQDPSDTRLGFLAGAFADVATPAGFDVMVDGYVVQRGGTVDLDGLDAEVEATYLTMGIFAKGRLGLGPAQLYIYGGPHVDTHLRTKAAGELVDAYREAAGQTFGLTAGAGLEVALSPERAVYVDIRIDEGLTDAFPDPAEQIRHRTVSLVVRLARTPGG